MTKRNNIIYWISTALLCFGMLASGIAQLGRSADMQEIITHLGFPLYIMYIVGAWKVLGVTAILVPKFGLLKEWAYAGFFFLMSGALISHLFMGDVGNAVFGPLFQLMFTVLSWYFRPQHRKINVTPAV